MYDTTTLATKRPTTDELVGTSDARPARTIWMPWLDGGRPNTAIEEATFLRRLADLADDKRTAHHRSDITAVLNALRCGLEVDDLLTRAPGLVPARLYDGYLTLDRLRHRSESAWESLVELGSVGGVVQYGPEASKLAPSLISQLYSLVTTDPDAVPRTIDEMDQDVRSAAEFVRSIERALHDSVGNAERCTSLSRLLYDPEGSGATSSPDHVARRVGTLVPTAVAALLGERNDFRSPPTPPGRQ